MEKFTVTLNHHAHYGYVEYDPETKTASVVLDVPEAKARVEEFLSKPLTLDCLICLKAKLSVSLLPKL